MLLQYMVMNAVLMSAKFITITASFIDQQKA